ncbi:hypothetical protein BJF78_06065 [Pseudonocardia sp. CNS-139]|nr:hypothetical protein BJF78_06065 [Pseudonocardia sp. CNS-139]
MTDTPTAPSNPTYRGPSGAGAPRLAGLPGVAREEAGPRQVIETERHDTEDRRLAVAGVVLAVTHRDGAAHWRLGLPGDAGQVVPAADERTPPAGLAAAVHGIAGDRDLRPAGRVRRVRTRTRLLAANGALLAEVLHDQVTVATFGRSTDVESWTDVQVVPAAAGGHLLHALADRITAGGMRPAPGDAESELSRMLRPSPDGWQPGGDDPAGAVLMAYVGEHAARLATRTRGPAAASPTPCTSCGWPRAGCAAPCSPTGTCSTGSAPTRWSTGCASWAGRSLPPATRGAARTDHRRAARPPGAGAARHRAGAGHAALRAAGGRGRRGRRRHVGRRRLHAAAGLPRRLLRDPPLTERAVRPAADELPVHVRRAARRLDRAVTVAVDPDAPAEERDTAVHTARKAGKRLRYATEVAIPALGKDATRFARSMKKFQDALGEHQDTVVARGALRELGATAPEEGGNGFSFGVLHERDAARAARIEAELPGLWKEAWKRGNRRWLG